MGGLRCHPFAYLLAKVFDLRSNFLGYCSRIHPTFPRRFNIAIDAVNEIEVWLAASSNFTNEIWIADGGFTKIAGTHAAFP